MRLCFSYKLRFFVLEQNEVISEGEFSEVNFLYEEMRITSIVIIVKLIAKIKHKIA